VEGATTASNGGTAGAVGGEEQRERTQRGPQEGVRAPPEARVEEAPPVQ